MGAHTQQEEASLTSCSPIGAAGRENVIGKVKEKTRDNLLEEEKEGGWDWLVVVGRSRFQARYST